MKLIKFSKKIDYGTDFYLQVLFTKRWALFQGCVSWCEYPGWPYIQIRFGMGSILDILFNVHKFGLCLGFLERTWNFDYLKNLDGTLEELTQAPLE